MGELIKMAAQGTLHYVPKQEFGRVRSISASATACTDLFATLARINTLYMIASGRAELPTVKKSRFEPAALQGRTDA